MSKLQLNRKLFTFLLAKPNFHTSDFRFVIFNALFSIIYFSIYKFCAKNFKLLLANSNFHVSAFHVQLFKFLLTDSNFHASDFQVSIFQVFAGKFLLANSNFHASALLIFCGNKCLFPNCFYLRNFGTSLQ